MKVKSDVIKLIDEGTNLEVFRNGKCYCECSCGCWVSKGEDYYDDRSTLWFTNSGLSEQNKAP